MVPISNFALSILVLRGDGPSRPPYQRIHRVQSITQQMSSWSTGGATIHDRSTRQDNNFVAGVGIILTASLYWLQII